MHRSPTDSTQERCPHAPNPPGTPGDPALLKGRTLIFTGVLLALFLGALDALVVGSAMPTIVSDLGGLHFYSWVFSSYMLLRAISLPIIGKLCDLYSTRKLYVFSISIFVISSVLAGAARNMTELILFRGLQGIGAGGTFALAMIVVSELSPPETRGKMLGLTSFVWGVASILGPATGGFIVTFLSWRWIFYINLPLGFIALITVVLYLKEFRHKKQKVAVDYAGIVTLSAGVLALLTAFMLGGRTYPWLSWKIGLLFLVTLLSTIGFYYAEKRAVEPVLALSFFKNKGFSLANGSAFFSSFAIFALSAFSPLFIQGALGKTPAQLGIAMIPLSLCWSLGSISCGQIITRKREKAFSLAGSIFLLVGAGSLLTFTASTPLAVCSGALATAGLGMGFVSVSTLLAVQNSLHSSNLGVATSSQQFARTVGGTIGIGVSGGFIASNFSNALAVAGNSSATGDLSATLPGGIEGLFQPEVLATLPPGLQDVFREAVAGAVTAVFWCAFAAAFVSLLFCCFFPAPAGPARD